MRSEVNGVAGVRGGPGPPGNGRPIAPAKFILAASEDLHLIELQPGDARATMSTFWMPGGLSAWYYVVTPEFYGWLYRKMPGIKLAGERGVINPEEVARLEQAFSVIRGWAAANLSADRVKSAIALKLGLPVKRVGFGAWECRPVYDLPLSHVDGEGWWWYRHDRVDDESGGKYPGVTREDCVAEFGGAKVLWPS